MVKTRGRYVNGQIVFDGPKPDWAEGTELDIAPHRNGAYRDDWDDDDRVETPEEIEAWIREVEAIPPMITTPEEEASFNEWMKKVGGYNKAAVKRQYELGIEGSP